MNEFIFLYGPPGVGKSTVGHLLAKQLNLPFVDLDSTIEHDEKKTIKDIFADAGESTFRRLESKALQLITKGEPCVVALGGGALIDKKNRSECDLYGKIVVLNASLETLILRVSSQPDTRPLVNGEIQAKLAELLAKRENHYRDFEIQIETDGLSPDQIVGEVTTHLGRFLVRGMGAEYPVFIEHNAWHRIGKMLKSIQNDGHIFIVTDKNVAGIYLDQLVEIILDHSIAQVDVFAVPAGESSKTIQMSEKLWEKYLKAGLGRESQVIALGGGMVTDLAGFSAATYMRGIRWLALPTSLLAMVDASIGGKTGVDLLFGKNLVGSFHPPLCVLADLNALNTLPEGEWRNGLAEVIKHGVISDPILFQYSMKGLDDLQKNIVEIVSRAVRVKVDVICADPFEKGIRASLNLGHTVGHAVEHLSDYRISHGEAVSIGIVTEARMAEILGIARAGLTEEISTVLAFHGLPLKIPDWMSTSELVAILNFDKKHKGGKVRFALPRKIGQVEVGQEIEDLPSLLSEARGIS